MDYVPQNMGIEDKPYSAFTEANCRTCHGASTTGIHHSTQPALEERCLIGQGGCHDVIPDPPAVEPVRDCKICHTGDETVYPELYAVWGDLGYPHHNSELAETGQCDACHEHVVEAYTVPPPSYLPSSTTPSPASCENCHFWDDPVDPTIHGNGHIMSWGTFGFMMHPDKVALGFDPDNLPSKGTHMETGGQVYSQCYFCHSDNIIEGGNWDPYDAKTIRFCENCHTIELLHDNPEHRDTNSIYTVNGIPNQQVTAEEKCTACHETDLLRSYPPELVPTQGGYGTTLSVDGFRFGDQPSAMMDSQYGCYRVITFSDQSMTFVATRYPLWSDLKLKVKFKDLFADGDGDYLQDEDEPFLSQDQLSLEDYTLTVKTVWFRDQNNNGAYDNGEEIHDAVSDDSPVFTLTDAPVISAIRPDPQEPGKVIRIKGYNFGDTQGASVVHVGNRVYDSTSPKIKLWSDTKIRIRLRNYPCTWFNGRDVRRVKTWVTVGGTDSNKKKLKVLKPAACP
jgi:hypothetical protein